MVPKSPLAIAGLFLYLRQAQLSRSGSLQVPQLRSSGAWSSLHLVYYCNAGSSPHRLKGAVWQDPRELLAALNLDAPFFLLSSLQGTFHVKALGLWCSGSAWSPRRGAVATLPELAGVNEGRSTHREPGPHPASSTPSGWDQQQYLITGTHLGGLPCKTGHTCQGGATKPGDPRALLLTLNLPRETAPQRQRDQCGWLLAGPAPGGALPKPVPNSAPWDHCAGAG